VAAKATEISMLDRVCENYCVSPQAAASAQQTSQPAAQCHLQVSDSQGQQVISMLEWWMLHQALPLPLLRLKRLEG
jgi:hypothetical protein